MVFRDTIAVAYVSSFASPETGVSLADDNLSRGFSDLYPYVTATVKRRELYGGSHPARGMRRGVPTYVHKIRATVAAGAVWRTSPVTGEVT